VKVKIWFSETRPQFLLLSVVLIFLGTSIAWYEGSLSLSLALLAFAGLLLLHISVNTLNDYFDYRSGIDLEVKRTPFTGGSGILPAGLLAPTSVYRFGILCFLFAIPIGIYFLIRTGLPLLPILIVAAICVLFYTTHLARWQVGEITAGLGMGTLPVLGAYLVQSGAYSPQVLVAAIPPGILVYNLLLLNEFPDVEADKKAGRRNLPIGLGKGKAAKIYSGLTIAVYIWIIAAVAARFMPPFALLGLLTIPLALGAIRGALSYEQETKLLPALGANVFVVLATPALLAIGYIVGNIL